MNSPVEISVRKLGALKRNFEFWLNDKQIGALDYTKRWCNDAEIRFNDQKWTITSSGFWKKTIELSAEQSPYTKMQIPFKWSYKMTVSPNNRDTYKLVSKGFWRRRWFWEDARQNEVIELKSNAFSKKKRGSIIINQPINNELLLVALFGWYLLMGYEAQTASTIAITAST